jgi:hypothetical protein
MIRRIAIYSIALFYSIHIYAQFPDKVGTPSCDAIDANSTLIQSWAISSDIKRGRIFIADTLADFASFGISNNALGKADNRVISLGDGGIATLTFHKPIVDGPGADFAVFENSFEDHFLELAFVEVSSDGINFIRFPAISNTQDSIQIGTFDYIKDISGLHNLAGKYKTGYGTPFDLSELKNHPDLNINAITHIRIIDIIGSIDDQYASKDSRGKKINDPWPTPFETCGFDLDAIAVINQQDIQDVQVFPNPLQRGSNLQLNIPNQNGITKIYSYGGQLIYEGEISDINTSTFVIGSYILITTINNEMHRTKFTVK